MDEFKVKLRKRNISKEELISDLQRVAEEAGNNKITATLYTDKGNFGVNTISRKFGSWNKGLEESGLALSNRVNIPDEELFENISNVWRATGQQPVGKDMFTDLSKFSLGTYEKRYGSWNNALIEFINFVENEDYEFNSKETLVKSGKNTIKKRTPRKINWRLRAKVLIKNNCICCMCGASPAKDADVTLHIDHIIPWSKGGETEFENLQTLCSVCNIGKSDELL